MTDSQVVYVHAFLLDTGARALSTQADLLAQRVAHRMRLLVGSHSDSLTYAEPLLTWRSNLGGNLAVMVHRDGRTTWQELLPMPIPDTIAARFLARALAAVVEHGESVGWTGEAARDSVALRLALGRSAEPNYSTAVGPGFPVFKLRKPRESEPELATHPPVTYPLHLKQAGVGGHVVIEVTIDTAGRPVPSSIHDIQPADFAFLRPDQLAAYQEFVEVSIDLVRDSRFHPAHIGTCPISASIHMPLNYTVVGTM